MPEGSLAVESAVKVILDLAVLENKAVAGDEYALAVAESSCAELAAAEAGKFCPAMAVGGAVTPLSGTKNAY